MRRRGDASEPDAKASQNETICNATMVAWQRDLARSGARSAACIGGYGPHEAHDIAARAPRKSGPHRGNLQGLGGPQAAAA